MDLDSITINHDATIMDAIKGLSYAKHRCLLVISVQNKLLGVLSEGDILRSLYDKKNLQTPLINIINKNFKYLDEKNSSMLEAKKLFKKFSVLIIPVLDKKGRLKSLYHINDIL